MNTYRVLVSYFGNGVRCSHVVSIPQITSEHARMIVIASIDRLFGTRALISAEVLS